MSRSASSRFLRTLIAFTFAAALAACGGSGGGQQTDTKTPDSIETHGDGVTPDLAPTDVPGDPGMLDTLPDPGTDPGTQESASEGSEAMDVFDADAVLDSSDASDAEAIEDIVPDVDLPPTVAFIEPVNGATVSGEVVIKLDAADDHGIAQVEFFVYEEPLETLTEAPWETTWDATGLPGGNYELTAIVTDNAGQQAEKTITVFLAGSCNDLGDCPPTSVKFINPVKGSVLCGTTTLIATATDDNGVRDITFLVDQTVLGLDSDAPYTMEWDTLLSGDGEHVLTAMATDAEGQSTFQSIAVGVDNFGETCDNFPNLSIDEPAPGAYLKGIAPIKVGASDDKGVVRVQFYIDNGLITEDNAVPYYYDWDTAEFDEGAHVIKAVAVDTIGQATPVERQVTIDRSAPTVAIVEPASGLLVHEAFTLKATVADNFKIASVRFVVPGHEDVVKANTPFSIDVDPSDLPSGPLTLRVEASDAAGSTASDQVGVVVDRLPTIEVTAPAADETVFGVVAFTLDAADAEGLEHVRWLVDDAEVHGVTASLGATYTQTFQLDTSTLAFGAHTLSGEVVDSSGQSATHAVSVTVDQPLSVALALCDGVGACSVPAASDEIAGAWTLAAQASDDNGTITGVTFFAGALEVATDNEAPFEAAFDSTTVPDGAVTLKAVVSSDLGLQAEDSFDVTVNNCDRDHDTYVSDAASCGGDDCDDGNAARYPGAEDTVGDGVDQNCDSLDGVDADGDGWASEASGGTDCDDGDDARFPGNADPIGDGVDGNCDGVDGVDADRDGFVAESEGGDDCDDANPNAHPGASDAFGDRVDQNCDGVDGVDGDGDGFAGNCQGLTFEDVVGDASDAQIAITNAAVAESAIPLDAPAQAEVVSVSGQVTFTHAYWADVVVSLKSPAGTEFLLRDGQGGGADGETTFDFAAAEAFDGEPAQGDWTLRVSDKSAGDDGTLLAWELSVTYSAFVDCDCDDANTDKNPGAADTVGDGVDQNCDGADGVDKDGDQRASLASGGTDCEDTDATRYPGAQDTVGDGIDQNCDDADGVDGDGDGFASEASGGDDCVDDDAAIHPDAADPVGDDVDSNCDGADGVDKDGDGYAPESEGGDDCDDNNAARYPGAPDTCNDGVDNDCDGADGVDVDQDGFGSQASGCDDCEDSVDTTYPGAPDSVSDGVDNNCDGVDGVDADGDTFASEASGGDDCDDDDPVVKPGAPDLVGSRCSLPGATTETLAGGGGAPALASVGDTLHVSFYGTNHLKYGSNAGGSWAFQDLGGSAYVGTASDLAVTAAGDVVLAYNDELNAQLRVASRVGGSWSDVAADTTFGAGGAPSVAIGTDGRRHVAHYDWNQYDLRYATSTGASWTTEIIDGQGDVGSASDIVVTPAGEVHVVYYDATNRDLKHAVKQAAGWMVETLDSEGDRGRGCSAAVGADGRIVAAYVDYTHDALRLATFSGGGWTFDTIVASGVADDDTSVGLSAQGFVTVAFVDLSGRVKLATNRYGAWGLGVIESGGQPSLALASTGDARVAYKHASAGLKLATEACVEWGLPGVDENCDGVDGVDGDGDTYPSEASGGDDCADDDAAVNPAAADTVGDAADQNCDGVDGVDADGDTFASEASGGDDCDDDDPTIHPGGADAFGDGLDTNCDGVDGVDVDGDGYLDSLSGGDDCNDDDPAIHPGVLDYVGDGLDTDCDGADGQDADKDGHASELSGGDDCNDADPATYLGAADSVGDKVDQNCDGADGEDLDYDGQPSEASGGTDCHDGDPNIYWNAPDLVGDGIDQDCDGADGRDRDGDQHATEASGGDDCNDADATIYLGAPDPHGDFVDQDCDGADGIDLDQDGFGGNCTPFTGTLTGTLTGSNTTDYPIYDKQTTTSTVTLAGAPAGALVTYVQGTFTISHSYWGDLEVSVCPPGGTCALVRDNVGGSSSGTLNGTFSVASTLDGLAPNGGWSLKVYDTSSSDQGTLLDWSLQVSYQKAGGTGFDPTCDCKDNDPAINPGAVDAFGDGIDKDCDGVDGTDHDGDGHRTPATGGDDCDDADANNYPGKFDDCSDGRDNNCDGVDGEDGDGDGFGQQIEGSGCLDCDDQDADRYPGNADTVGDGKDNNCDGADGVDADGDDFASEASGGDDCDDTQASFHPGAADTVGDGQDQNCDGLDGVDADGDDVASVTSGGTDCDDENAEVYPAHGDTVGDGVDNNCDGIDGVDADQDGYAGVASGGTDCADDDAGVNPAAVDYVTGYCTSSSVTTAVVDGTGQPGFYASLVVDASNVSHVAYYEQQLKNLKYANDSTGEWFPANADFADDVGKYAALAQAPDGSLRVAYQDTTHGTLEFATNAGGTWAVSTIHSDAAGAVGKGVDLALDAGGKSHVVFGDAAQNRVAYATDASGAWVVETVAVGTTSNVAIALLPSGQPVVFFHDAAASMLKLATRGAAGAWTVEEVFPASGYTDAGRGLDLGVDGAGTLHLAFAATANESARLYYARQVAAAWDFHVVDQSGTPGTSLGLAVSAQGMMALAYVDDATDQLRLVTNRGTMNVLNFRSFTLDTIAVRDTTDAFFGPSPAFAPDGRILVAYRLFDYPDHNEAKVATLGCTADAASVPDANCDGLDGVDGDGDGYASYASGGDDCNDHNNGIHPGAADPNESGSDALDQACDGFDDPCLLGVSPCDDGNVCTLDTCRFWGAWCENAVQVGADCSGTDWCTPVAQCVDVDGQGVCQGQVRDCDDGNVCTTDFCGIYEGPSGCWHYPDSMLPECADLPACETDLDCNDGNADTWDACLYGYICFNGPDEDHDGYVPEGQDWFGLDCDDTDPLVNPGATDTVGDGVDNNCDGVDGVDADGDGHANEASGGDDCDDTKYLVYPGRAEACNNDDDDCDTYVDEDAANSQGGFGTDLCAAGKWCVDGACVCKPACEGKACGPDGCGGTCGTCGADQVCDAAGQCVADPVGITWIPLAAGTYQMGSTSGSSNEKPVHAVTLSAFEMAKSEITWSQFAKCKSVGTCTDHADDGSCYYYNGSSWVQGALPASYRGTNQPAICVDWYQARDYCEWAGARLCTEAEWEYAARSGGQNRTYPWGDQTATCSYAVMSEGGYGCGTNSTWAVCSKAAGNSTQGVCDLAGNVWEWVADWYGTYPSTAQTNPTGPSSGSNRVYRGGSWYDGAHYLRAAFRYYGYAPGGDFDNLGLRCCRSSN